MKQYLRKHLFGMAALVAALASPGCLDDSLLRPIEVTQGDGQGEFCLIDPNEILSGGPGKDGIPALTDPPLVQAGGIGTEYLRDDDRVIGILLGGSPLAIPHNIGWWHEIVNINSGPIRLAVTYCPLTGSSMVFDRSPIGGAELGVSGLIYRNNLIMYDRNTSESLWPQMERGARCGPRSGTELPMLSAMEMTWQGWRTLYPQTSVVAGDPDGGFNYWDYPYPGNEDLASAPFFPGPPPDPRRPPKERVLGIPSGSDGGIAFPFLALDELGPLAVVTAHVDDEDLAVFWDRTRQAAVAFRPIAGGKPLTFEVHDTKFVDVETGSEWKVNGLADSGPLAGSQLELVPNAFVSFWFAWAQFHPEALLWSANVQ